ncbi:hypothetical protein [Vibrio breoganii]|uniref:hypothetical protein n=1 Tax=Vibrio breoganii TaxID=553239 RepID=UPI000C828C1B|nr:hypothetical protein [Vibrio breoganii]PMK32513.1 hypothetical protein BCU03_04735 [Vibrio breoganii]
MNFLNTKFDSNIENQLEIFLQKHLKIFFSMLFLLTVFYSYILYLGHNGFAIGDWLTNYRAGFIRRGLLGELILKLSSISGVKLGALVSSIQIALYSVFFLYSYLLVKRKNSLIPYVLIICSSCVFTFQLSEPSAGFRKEIIFFAILSFFTYASVNFRSETFRIIFYSIILAYPTLILTHEMLLILYPYIGIVAINKLGLKLKVTLPLISGAIIGFIVTVITISFEITPEMVNTIMTSFEGYPIKIEGSAFHWLDKDTDFAFHQLSMRLNKYLVVFPIVLILSLVSFYPIRNSIIKTLFLNWFTILLFFISILVTITLAIVAVDWGRFIYINLTSIFIVSLYHSGETSNKWLYGNRVIILALFFVIYTCTWHIPNTTKMPIGSYVTLPPQIIYSIVNQ